MAHISIRMGIVMREIGTMTYKMELEPTITQTVTFTKVNG